MTSGTEIKTIVFDPVKHRNLLPSLVEIHIGCIQNDYTLLRFLPPFPPEKRKKVLEWWETRLIDGTNSGARYVIMEIAEITEPDGTKREEACGLVSLERDPSETGSFRANVQTLLVSPAYRRQGVATRLMKTLEEVALKDGRSLLMLGTETGSFAETFFEKVGFTPFGIIPAFGFSPEDGRLTDCMRFYKHIGFTKDVVEARKKTEAS